MKWLPWIVFAVFGFYLLGNNFNAKLGMIDDHEIAMFLGSDGKVRPDEFVPVLLSTEVGQWGSYLRYRPSYYTLRVIESVLWRENATLWYFSRYLMLVIAMYLGWKIMTKYFPEVVSYLFIFYVMTMPFWPDIVTRLGPSEIYAVPALLLFVYGMITNKLWMITLGYLVCIGSKENFLVLFPLLLGWAGLRAYYKTITRNELIATLVMILFTGLVVGAILMATAKAGADIYGSEISYRYRITKFVWDIPRIIESRHMIPALMVMIVAFFAKPRPWKYLVSMVVVLAIIASQYIFYPNQLPSNTRYDYPALLLFPVFDLMAVTLLIQLFSKSKLQSIIKFILYAMIIIGCSAYIFKRGYTLIQLRSQSVVQTSTQFGEQLNRAEAILKQNPSARVNFVSSRYIDFEPIVSVERYLSAKKIPNLFSLYYKVEKAPSDPMELHDRLTSVMEGELGNDHIFDRFSKFEQNDESCYSITFGASLPLAGCPEIARF